jgi:hypothetical protein
LNYNIKPGETEDIFCFLFKIIKYFTASRLSRYSAKLHGKALQPKWLQGFCAALHNYIFPCENTLRALFGRRNKKEIS